MEDVVAEDESIATVDIEVSEGQVVGRVQCPVSDVGVRRRPAPLAAVLQLIQRLQREKRVLVEYEPVEVVNEYAGLMDGFVTIARDQREHGLGNVTDQVRDKCCICQGDLLRSHRKRQFQCNRHRGHHSCVGSYYQRRQPGDRYLCPFKCAE